MKTTALLLILALALPCYAADDAPLLAPDVPNVSVRVVAGEASPFSGRLVTDDENLRRGRAIADCRAELAEAKSNVWISKGALIGIVVASLALGAAVSAGVAVAAKR